MSAVPALPAAARLPRSAAVRRALLAGLFLAGFVALGIAFGGGAQAADGSVSTNPQVGALAQAERQQASVKDSAAEAGREMRRGGKTAVGAAAETPVGKAVRPVAERAAPAAGQAAKPVTGPVAGRVTAPVRDVVREVRQVADADALPVELPGRIPGVGGDGDADGDGDTGRGDGHGEQPGQGSGPQQAGAGVQRGDEAANAVNPAHLHGRWSTTGELRGASSHSVQRVGSASERWLGQGRGSLPGLPGLPGQLPQAPASSAAHTAGDGHGPRGGDQFAAVPAHPAHFGLVPGGVLAAAEPPTRQRAADILEFPG
ncbi:hypothetical protein ACFYWU_32970 [Streptomyces chrestomyceticus]|uniref:hypothetical protein n=1 Tax=Streptomyces chrestomyceticus TaxID=68185 RepID=UPI0036788B31